MAQRTGKSVVETLRELELAEKAGMLHTKADGSVEIKKMEDEKYLKDWYMILCIRKLWQHRRKHQSS